MTASLKYIIHPGPFHHPSLSLAPVYHEQNNFPSLSQGRLSYQVCLKSTEPETYIMKPLVL